MSYGILQLLDSQCKPTYIPILLSFQTFCIKLEKSVHDIARNKTFNFDWQVFLPDWKAGLE
ncbi:hypothetical protein AM500_01735 [Bacillus sp. FJAT-18017]|nr:hypothetical protein AM500_01735 [Bacillus sp. FJAT-18017]